MLTEKYRPKKLREIVGQDRVISVLETFVKKKEYPHLLFIGPPGCGKTTTAYAFANELNTNIVELNASDERGIDVIRSKVKALATTTGERIILLDEADRLTDEAQHALRRIMEKAPSTVHFIITANEAWRIIDPIKSRCAIFNFSPLDTKDVLKVILKILKSETTSLELTQSNKTTIIQLINTHNGDLRQILNDLSTMIVDRQFVPRDLQELLPSQVATNILNSLKTNSWEDNLRQLEDLLVTQPNSYEILKSLHQALKSCDFPLNIKLKLYDKLSDIERNLKIGCSPVIQFSGFLALAWFYLHTTPGGEESGATS